MVMDLAKGTLEGASIGDSSSFKYSTQSLLYILQGAAKGLAFLHAGGLVHRDIKPSNILLQGQRGHERGMVGDFGLAKIRSSNSQRRGTAFAGTLTYADPATLSGAPQDASSDVYAFGITMWEALSGKPAFSELDTEGPAVFINKIARDGVRPPIEGERDVVVPVAHPPSLLS